MTYWEACAVLAVREDAPLPVAEAAYRALSKSSHPDSGGSNALMTALNTAIEVFRKGAPPREPYIHPQPAYRWEPDEFEFLYGKHAGQSMREVPLSYLRWWSKNEDGNDRVREAAIEWLEWRQAGNR